MRKYGKGCSSHLVLREKNGGCIFADEIWKHKLLIAVSEVQKSCPMTVYAFCVLDEEAHFLIQMEAKEQISQAEAWIEQRFRKYIQETFGRGEVCLSSQTFLPDIDQEEQLLAISICIHLLPQRKNCVRRYSDYYWSSYREYRLGIGVKLVCTATLLDYLDADIRKARKKFAARHRRLLSE